MNVRQLFEYLDELKNEGIEVIRWQEESLAQWEACFKIVKRLDGGPIMEMGDPPLPLVHSTIVVDTRGIYNGDFDTTQLQAAVRRVREATKASLVERGMPDVPYAHIAKPGQRALSGQRGPEL